ncbi:MAG: MFS transporter [Candidatus Acidiferrales bacterium]
MKAAYKLGAPVISQEVIYGRVSRRFLPLLFTCYLFNYVDRTNIGFAQLQMRGDLGLSAMAYGLGAGIFFVSYSLFAVPSNLLMIRIGARKTIFSCLFLWGLTSSATMLVRTPAEFYAARLLLGVVEAGFFPGIIFYFTQWYPSDRRANVTGIFQSATVVAGIVSGLMSGALMTYLNGLWTLRGWQWMFLLEGIPSLAMGILVLLFLDDSPQQAAWLSNDEKAVILDALSNDRATSAGRHTFREALGDWRVYFLGFIFFSAVIGTYALAFWQPIMIRDFNVSSVMRIGIYSTIPAAAAVVAKIWIGHHSDKHRELRWHFAAPALAGAVGMLLIPLISRNPAVGIACLALAMAGVHGCIPVFWSIPGLYFSGTAAAGGIALISTLGNFAGAVGPVLLGYAKNETGTFNGGMYTMSALLLIAAVLTVTVVSKGPAAVLRDTAVESEP